MAWVSIVASLVVLWVATLCKLITRFNCLKSISQARPPDPADVLEKDEGKKKKKEGEKSLLWVSVWVPQNSRNN